MNTATLAQSMLFHGMTKPEILSALDTLHGEDKGYEKGSVVLHAGETTDRMGMVLSGRVTVESTDVWGNRTILSLLDAGQFFREVYALLPGEVLLVDVRVVEDCRILFLTLSGLSGNSEPWAGNCSGTCWLSPLVRIWSCRDGVSTPRPKTCGGG